MNLFRVIHLPTQDDATTVAFVERTCQACAGEGCDTCHGGGTVGSVEQVATRQVAPSPEADRARRNGAAFRRHRVDAGVSLGDVADALGLGVVELSDVERGLATFDPPDDFDRALAVVRELPRRWPSGWGVES